MHRSLFSSLTGQALCLGNDLLDVADHVEGDLWQMVVLAGEDLLESRDGLVDGDELAGVIGENFGNLRKWMREASIVGFSLYLEWLGEEPLDFPCPGNLQLVFLGQLVHTQNSDDVLK